MYAGHRLFDQDQKPTIKSVFVQVIIAVEARKPLCSVKYGSPVDVIEQSWRIRIFGAQLLQACIRFAHCDEVLRISKSLCSFYRNAFGGGFASTIQLRTDPLDGCSGI